MNNLRFAVRTLIKSPAFTIVALVSLALGIGVNTIIFTVVNSMLLRPLPVERPEELVEVYSSTPSERFPQSVMSYLDFVSIRDSNDVFSGITAHALAGASLRDGDAAPRRVLAEVVSAEFFEVMGVAPLMGRGFTPEEGVTEGTHPVVVLGQRFWTTHFGADPSIVGRIVRINTMPFTVIGVVPRSFTGMLPAVTPDIWLPLMMSAGVSFMGINDSTAGSSLEDLTRLEHRGQRWLFVKGRLAEGSTIEQAQANASAIMARLEETYPETNEERGASLVPTSSVRFHPLIDSQLTPVAGLLLGVVGLVLLIACANVANMSLARASSRRREIAVRLALGASRARLIGQLLTESLLLATCGGALGLLLSVWASNFILSLDAVSQLSVSFDFSVDVRVMSFAVLASLGTGLAFGLAPALRASRPELVPALKEGQTVRRGAGRILGMRDVLVVSQIAVSLLLLVAAALLVRSLQAAQTIDPGFDVERTAMQEMSLDMIGLDAERADAFQKQYLERVRALPGVEAAALTGRIPLTANVSITGIYVPGVHESPDDEGDLADSAIVGSGYFETLGIPIVAGRDFVTTDNPDSPPVAIINETMARTYWPGESAVGKRFRTGGIDGTPIEIVGVARDHKVRTLGEEPRPYVLRPRERRRSTDAILIARTAGDPTALVGALRRELSAFEPDLLAEPHTVREAVEFTLLPLTMGATLLGGFGVLAMLLAAVGLYGVISYSVSRRVREIGIRIALGADYLGVVKLVVRRGMVLAVVGIFLGALAAASLSSLLQSVLYGISGVDPIAFGGAALLLLIVAFTANYIPARRAARVDPLMALRSE